MWIGEQRIILKNMSKNQRAYWREMRRIYNEAKADGFNVTGQEFIETYAPSGHISSNQIQEATQLTGETLIGYDRDFENAKVFIDNLIDDLTYSRKRETEKGRKRTLTNGEAVKFSLGYRLKELVSIYNYEIVYQGWMNLPYEIRAKIDSSASGDRYEGYEAALGIIDELVAQTATGYDDYDGPEE